MPNLLRRVEPGQGRESVWDYPRPPRLEKVSDVLRVRFKGETIAETGSGCRVLETSHPPVYYFPMGDVRTRAYRTLPWAQRVHRLLRVPSR